MMEKINIAGLFGDLCGSLNGWLGLRKKISPVVLLSQMQETWRPCPSITSIIKGAKLHRRRG